MLPAVLLLALQGGPAFEVETAVEAFDAAGGGFHGVVLVAAKGKVVFEKAYGPADVAAKKPIATSALWDWASATKQFTAAAILKLQDQKKLKVDDPLSKFYKDAPADKAKVTLRQLLNHSSGIEAGFKAEWKYDRESRESFEKMFLALPMTSKPGEKWEYSNSAYTLLAAIVERVSGKSYEDYCIESLFRPAGMKETTFIGRKIDGARVPRAERGAGFPDGRKSVFAYGDTMQWMYRGCGGAVATVRELYAWDQALRGDKILSKAAKQELFTPALNDYASGWMVLKSYAGPRAEHGGDVEGSHVYISRLLDEDVVVLIASTERPKQGYAILADQLMGIVRPPK